MARSRSVYDHFIIWPSSVTLTVNQPEQMFQMELSLLTDNNCAKLFWNPCINVQVIARSKLNLWPFYHLAFKCDRDGVLCLSNTVRMLYLAIESASQSSTEVDRIYNGVKAEIRKSQARSQII